MVDTPEGVDAVTVALLQASVYIAVDMLPIPGAQGITEPVYRNIFAGMLSGTPRYDLDS